MTEQFGAAQAPDPGAVQKEKRVTITLSESPKSITVDPDVVRLQKIEQHTATWEGPAGKPFEIEFKGGLSPFSGPKFNHQTAKKLAIRSDVPHNPSQPYKYTVRVEGYPDLDPAVVIDP